MPSKTDSVYPLGCFGLQLTTRQAVLFHVCSCFTFEFSAFSPVCPLPNALLSSYPYLDFFFTAAACILKSYLSKVCENFKQ